MKSISQTKNKFRDKFYTQSYTKSLHLKFINRKLVVVNFLLKTYIYGGKIAAALSRQHPRDLFDCNYLNTKSFEEIKEGLILSLLGSDKPIIESFWPNAINQKKGLMRH